MKHSIYSVLVVVLSLTMVSCDDVQYNDRNLDIDLVACLGAKESSPSNTCRERIDDEASTSSDNGCLILAIGGGDAPKTAYISVQWKNGWFDLGASSPIEASPGDPVSAEFYVFSKDGQAQACNGTSIPFGSSCTDSEPCS